ncbi:S1C family serine protease [Olivibacter sitiensis]|uniref:S1C family serine protease n=1 Tax=Olivibacter sitiensis TaxID=376470 RepID=UPI00042685AB|nr:serine protease [Olivibacter sitiensis]
MRSDQEFLEWADAYLKGELSQREQIEFERYCNDTPYAQTQLEEHRSFLKYLGLYGDRVNLQQKMDAIHAELDMNEIRLSAKPHKPVVVRIWNKYKINSLVAASVALLAVFSTLWLTGYFTNVKDNSSQYSALRRDMNSIARRQNALVKEFNKKNSDGTEKDKGINPSHYGATGFALSSDGYLVTNYHVVDRADSIYVQGNDGQSYKTKVVHMDKSYDIAILQIDDPNFEGLAAIPYTFKKGSSDIGEDVFTIGFPRDEAVYGRGYLSSQSDYAGDTIAYQVSIPVNPGNSGGPLVDNHGNIIGIVKGKQTQADGAAFAIKTKFLLKSLEELADVEGEQIVLNKRNNLGKLNRAEQIKKIQDFVFMVKVY